MPSRGRARRAGSTPLPARARLRGTPESRPPPDLARPSRPVAGRARSAPSRAVRRADVFRSVSDASATASIDYAPAARARALLGRAVRAGAFFDARFLRTRDLFAAPLFFVVRFAVVGRFFAVVARAGRLAVFFAAFV